MNEGLAPAALAHSQRFCQMGSGYPHAVALAYGGLAQAMHDDPETVAAEVADRRRNYGEQPRDWSAIGRDEGHPGVDLSMASSWSPLVARQKSPRVVRVSRRC